MNPEPAGGAPYISCSCSASTTARLPRSLACGIQTSPDGVRYRNSPPSSPKNSPAVRISSVRLETARAFLRPLNAASGPQRGFPPLSAARASRQESPTRSRATSPAASAADGNDDGQEQSFAHGSATRCPSCARRRPLEREYVRRANSSAPAPAIGCGPPLSPTTPVWCGVEPARGSDGRRSHGIAIHDNPRSAAIRPRVVRHRDGQDPSRELRLQEQLSSRRRRETAAGRADLQSRGRSLSRADARRLLVSRVERHRGRRSAERRIRSCCGRT